MISPLDNRNDQARLAALSEAGYEPELALRLMAMANRLAAGQDLVTALRISEVRLSLAPIWCPFYLRRPPEDPGTKIEVFAQKCEPKGIVSKSGIESGDGLQDLHCFATFVRGKWWCIGSSLQLATSAELAKAGALWRPIRPPSWYHDKKAKP